MTMQFIFKEDTLRPESKESKFDIAMWAHANLKIIMLLEH